MSRTVVVLLALAAPSPALEILPKTAKYDPAVPRPDKALGFAVGSRHLHHHQLVSYMRDLAKSSPRVTIREYGKTHGDRPLVLLTITSPENHKRLDSIREQHLKLADPKRSADVAVDSLPAVLVMGYGVHGNEPSASNVAPLVAYHLAAATGEAHERLLRETVVLLDPCLNPDGFERFAQWANGTRGAVANPDPEHREHREAWPGGRTNYYYFDLNRDWVPAAHPETRGRLAVYHQWKPNLVLDFHEMGSNSTYFFQPGVPRRNHPLIPAANLELTRGLAKYHARAMDRIGSLYFTEEQFDDYYPGKGSTYPDLHGGVGVLFEQASSRGQVQDTPNGPLTFPFTIRNQFTTSLSSLEGLLAAREKFLAYKRDFYRGAVEQASRSETKAIAVSAPGNAARLREFLTLLRRHDIRAHRDGDRYLIPTSQTEIRFLEALFETRTGFADKVFYDISAWSLPLAFDVNLERVERLPPGKPAEAFEPGPHPEQPFAPGEDDVAYAIDWRSDLAPRALHGLLAAGVKVRVASSPFAVVGRRFGHGTIVVPLGLQPERRPRITESLRAAAKGGLPVAPLTTGLTTEGVKLGSSALLPVPPPRVLLVTGEGVTAYEAGEVWHLLDRRLAMPVTMVDTHRLGAVELGKYTAVVLVSGTYAGVSTAASDRLREYAERGGTLVAVGTAIPWLSARKVIALPGGEKEGASGRRPYAAMEEDAAERLISGAIFRTRPDATHPVCWGLAEGATLPVFRNNRVILEVRVGEPYNTPVLYDESPLLSGYVSKANLARLAGSASVAVAPVGSGRAILFADNPNFRGFWRGTERLFVNALFFGPLTRTGPARGR
jgi:hypothetical protein